MYEVNLSAIDSAVDDALAVIDSYIESGNTADLDYAEEMKTTLSAMKLAIRDRCRDGGGDSFITNLAAGTSA
jgi:hypothetical protein